MKMWRFSDPCNYAFARASRRGTWHGKPAQRVKPLIIEWEPGSDKVGDFTWPGFDSDIVITQTVADALTALPVHGFELGEVVMQENSEREKRTTKEPIVRLPYQGLPLFDLWVTSIVPCDLVRSTIDKVESTDGSPQWQIRGVQRVDYSWNAHSHTLEKVVHHRESGCGLFVRAAPGIFRVREFPGWVFCSDETKLLIEAHRFSNVLFLEMGEIQE